MSNIDLDENLILLANSDFSIKKCKNH